MIDNSNHLEIVGDFLIRFYHEEPNDIQASTKAVTALTGLFDDEWKVATALKNLLEMDLPPGTLRDLVRFKANRHALDDDDARQFLERVYQNNDFENAINFEDYED